MSWACAVSVSVSKGQGLHTLITENGFCLYNCFPVTSTFIKLHIDSQRVQVVPLGQPHSSHHICQLWPWPLTSIIYRVHPFVIVIMSAKHDEEAHNGLVSIVFTGSKHERRAHWRMEPQQRYYIPSAMRCEGIKISMPTHSVDLSNIDLKSFNICWCKRYLCCWDSFSLFCCQGGRSVLPTSIICRALGSCSRGQGLELRLPKRYWNFCPPSWLGPQGKIVFQHSIPTILSDGQ